MRTETVIRAIGDQEWLDSLATPVQEAVREFFESAGRGGAELKDFMHGRALGHPLHPALIDLPLGAWTLAAIFDAVEIVRGSNRPGAAETAIAIGLAGAVGAAITGVTDWSETDGRAKKIGLVHGVLNLSATGLYAISLLLRKRSRRRAIGVSMVAFGVAMTAAYLGGHLVYGEQVGVDHTATADQDQPAQFTAVLAEADLPDEKPTRVVAGEVAIVLVKRGKTIHALRETCTHLGGPLSEGTLEDGGIRCPWHGSRFCLEDGRVLEGPAVFPERMFDVRVRNGEIEVRARNATA